MWRHCVAEPARPGPGLLLRPALTNVDNSFDRLVHILDRYPFQPRVEVLFSSKQIRCGKAHERQAGTISAAANLMYLRCDAGARHRDLRVFDHVRMTIEYFFHVAILLLDHDLD